MNNDRPYFHYSSADLTQALEEARGELTILSEIDAELRTRNSRYIQRLIPVAEELIADAIHLLASSVRPPLPVISMIPSMAQAKLIDLWQKAKDGRIPNSDDAQAVIEAVEKEWEKRGAVPRDPDGYFPMPSTDASLGLGSLTGSEWVEKGLLRHFGYSVSENEAITEKSRRKILHHVFSITIPTRAPDDYLSQWGAASSAARLRKMANSLAAFARNNKRKSQPPEGAIQRWESDLQFLYEKYYVDHFKFDWPST